MGPLGGILCADAKLIRMNSINLLGVDASASFLQLLDLQLSRVGFNVATFITRCRLVNPRRILANRTFLDSCCLQLAPCMPTYAAVL
jgi:hypothetical protein